MINLRDVTTTDLSEFHDAELCQVLMDRHAGTLSLVFELDTKVRKTMSFAGIRAYKVSEIYFQNVVSRFRLSSLGGMPEVDIVWTLAWMLDQDEKGRGSLVSDVSKSLVADIQSGKYFLLYLEPSVGAEVAVIATEMVIGDEN